MTVRTITKIRLKKGDNVIVLSGKYKGKTGKVQSVFPQTGKVAVEGLNVIKRTIKASQTNPRPRTIEKTVPFWSSKLAIVEPTSKKPSKIGYKVGKDGKKVRVYKRSGKEIK